MSNVLSLTAYGRGQEDGANKYKAALLERVAEMEGACQKRLMHEATINEYEATKTPELEAAYQRGLLAGGVVCAKTVIAMLRGKPVAEGQDDH